MENSRQMNAGADQDGPQSENQQQQMSEAERARRAAARQARQGDGNGGSTQMQGAIIRDWASI